MTAMEIVAAIRIGDTSNMKDPWDVKQYTDEEAEQLIIEFAEAKEAEAYKAAMATIPDGGASCKMCMSNIKKECADKAVEWLAEASYHGYPVLGTDCDSLRAAIEGGQNA